MTTNRVVSVFAALLILNIVAFLLALSVSSADFWDLRVPRAVAGFSVGAMLAMAGVIMQVLLRNPLAEPYVLGISGGATVAALGCIMLGLGGLWISGGAFAGSFFSIMVVFVLARGGGTLNTDRLLLTGVVLAAGWGAVISFLLVLGPEQSLRESLFWLMGDLANPISPWWSLPVLFLALAAAWIMASGLDLLARGDDQAAVLGVEVRRLRVTCYILASLLTALAVTLAGPIGFVGLLVPHLMRLLVGAGHSLLLPASMLAGGALLMLVDVAARLMVPSGQLPVGVLTAVIGVPVFLFLLRRQGRAG